MKTFRTIMALLLISLLPCAGLAEEDRAIVFIHGLNSEAATWKKMIDLFVDNGLVKPDHLIAVDYSGSTSLIGNDGTIGKILESVHSWGIDVLDLVGFNSPIEEIAKEKWSEIDEFRVRRGCRKLCFVVHSMGGLVLRSMVQQGFLSDEDIDKVVTLATPHYGQRNLDIAVQTQQMDYGSEFMWELATASRSISPGKVFCLVGTGDKVVDYWAAALNGCSYQYVDKSHCHNTIPYGEVESGICECSGGTDDWVYFLIKSFFESGFKGETGLSAPESDKGAFLLQVVDDRDNPVEFADSQIVMKMEGRHGTYGDSQDGLNPIVNWSPNGAYAQGICAPFCRDASRAVSGVIKKDDQAVGLRPDKYKITVAGSKDGSVDEFTTKDEYEIENGRTTVARIPVVKQEPVDFVFLIDATRGDGIDSIRNAATRLIRDRLGCGKRDCRVAVADYRGFPTSSSGEPGEDAFTLRCGFTTDAEEAIRSLNAISADGENDAGASVYFAIASCLEGSGSKLGGWRREAVKTIALVCDAEPRGAPDPHANYTQEQIIGMLNAPEAGEGEPVGGVSLYPVLTTSSTSLASAFAPLAAGTGGKVVNSGNYDSVALALEKVIEQTVSANGFEYETVSVEENTDSVTIRVYGGNSSMPASVGYQVVSGVAVEGTDYTSDGEIHRLSWDEGERNYKTIIIPIVSDGSSPADECFSVILGDAENMGLGGTRICRISVVRRLTLKASNTKYGSVSGAGDYAFGTKVTLKAKAKSGYVFKGWYTDKACTKELSPEGYDNRNPTIKYVMPAKKVTIYAKFVSKSSDKKILKFTSATAKLAKTATSSTAGKAMAALTIKASSASLPSFTAKGLPKGMAIDKATGKITGKPTVPGKYAATVTVKSAAGNSLSQKVKLYVTVPSGYYGTFDGYALVGTKPAYVTFTSDKYGAVSGKVTYKGKGYSFKANYSAVSSTRAKFTPSIKIGSSTYKPVTYVKKATDGITVSEARGEQKGKFIFVAQKKPGLVKTGKALEGLIGGGVTVTNKKYADAKLPKASDKLKLKFAATDAVKVAGTIGGNDVSFSTTVIYCAKKGSVYTAEVALVEPKSGGYSRLATFTLTVGKDGRVSKKVSFSKIKAEE